MKRIPLDDRLPGLTDPEQVRSWRLTKAAVFFLIAVGVIVWLVVDQRKAAGQRELSRSGLAIQGRVTQLDSQRGGRFMAISYQFTHHSVVYEIQQRRVGDFNGLVSGGPVTVSIDPSNPLRCVTANELTHARFGWTPWLFGGVIVLMMTLAGVQAYKVLQPSRDPLATD